MWWGKNIMWMDNFQYTQHLKPWGEWATIAEDHIRFLSSQPRTRIGVHHWHILTQTRKKAWKKVVYFIPSPSRSFSVWVCGHDRLWFLFLADRSSALLLSTSWLMCLLRSFSAHYICKEWLFAIVAMSYLAVWSNLAIFLWTLNNSSTHRTVTYSLFNFYFCTVLFTSGDYCLWKSQKVSSSWNYNHSNQFIYHKQPCNTSSHRSKFFSPVFDVSNNTSSCSVSTWFYAVLLPHYWLIR